MSVPEPNLSVVATTDGAADTGPHNGSPVTGIPAPPPSQRLDGWLALVCRMVPDVRAAFAGFDDDPTGEFGRAAHWPVENSPTTDLVTAAWQALQRDEGTAREVDDDGDEILARRLTLGPGRRGAIAIAVPGLTDSSRDAIVQLLDWSAVWLDFASQPQSSDRAGDDMAGLLLAGLDAADSRRAATRMAGIIAASLDAERVSIGIVEKDDIELIALSHSAAFNPRLRLNRDITAAMAETIDEGCPVVYPIEAAGAAYATHAHERLCEGEPRTTACSIPMLDGEVTIGAVVVERAMQNPFSAEERDRISGCVDAVVRVTVARRTIDRSLIGHAADVIDDGRRWLRSRGNVAAKALLLAGLVGLAVMAFGTGSLQVSAPALLEGKIHRSLTAPIDGYIAEAPARAGDVLKAGDTIAVVDTRGLEFERRRWASERVEYQKAHRRAIAELDRAEATIMKARLGRATSQLALIEEQLQRATVTAPFDGMIVSGDLSRSMGAPVSRGDVLFEIAPLDDYRVELEVDERDIAGIEVGQTGHLALTALPGERLAFTVDQVMSVAESSDGRTVFRVEGQLDAAAPLLRPGMRGVGKIGTGEDRLFRVWTHGVVARVRLWLWSRTP